MTKKAEMETIYVQCDPEGVWVAQNSEMPKHHQLTPREFVARYAHGVDRIRLLGSSVNVPLLAELYGSRLRRDPIAPAYVCTPAVKGEDAPALFAAMREMNLHSSIGGWHELTEMDGPSYALAATLRSAGGRFNSASETLLREHRAWPALSFITGLDEISAANWLCELLDPRWFVSPTMPHSAKRLHNFLGLTPRNVENALAGRPATCRQGARCATTLACWFRHGSAADPGSFLLRLASPPSDKHKIQATLLACRRFTEFVSDVWNHMMAPPGRRLFVPKYFFAKDKETHAFQQHWGEFACWRGA